MQIKCYYRKYCICWGFFILVLQAFTVLLKGRIFTISKIMTSRWKPAGPHSTLFINFEKHFSVRLYRFPKSEIGCSLFKLSFLASPDILSDKVLIISKHLLEIHESHKFVIVSESLVNFVLVSTLSLLFNSYIIQIGSSGTNIQ